jgi:hypothetical protein
MKVSFYRPTKKEMKKVAIITATATVVITSLTITANAFFMNNYLSFQSPITIKSPVVVNQRELITPVVIEAENEVLEQVEETPNETKKEVEEVGFILTNRLVAHTKQRPDVYSKIVEYFGEDSQVAGELLSRESSLNPQAINPSSGACGLFQALPCEKLGCDLDDIDCQMKWGKNYIKNRYGDAKTALAFHDENGWY